MAERIRKDDSYSLKELAQRFDLKLCGDEKARVIALSAVDESEENTLVPIFSSNPQIIKQIIGRSSADAFVVTQEVESDANLLICNAIKRTIAELIEFFNPKPISVERSIAPTALIDDRATIGKNVSIGDYVTIGPDVTIGDEVNIGTHVCISRQVTIGSETTIDDHVTIKSDTQIGNRVHIGASSVIGGPGFGYYETEKGLCRIRHIGRVVIEDDVELGSNVCVDRATLGKTLLRKGAKIDNLVQIAHNVEVGEGAVICAQSGIAGSSMIGENVMLGGQTGVSDHCVIENGAKVAAQSGVVGRIKSEQVVAGTPARLRSRWLKEQTLLRRVEQLKKEIISLKKK